MMMTTTEEWLASLEDGHAEARDATALRAVSDALAAAEDAKRELAAAVAAARDDGWSWTEIAIVLGVSRQAARQRFGQAASRS